MEHTLKDLVIKDNMTNDTQYYSGLKKLRQYGVMFRDDDVYYYLYCNGIGCRRYR